MILVNYCKRLWGYILKGRGEIVCGSSGSGKDFWIKNNLSNLREINTNRLLASEVYNNNDEIMDLLQNNDKMKEYKQKIGCKILDISRYKDIVINTHLSHSINDAYFQDISIFEYIKNDNLKIILAEPEVILDRRINDLENRNRKIKSISDIEYEQEYEFNVAKTVCDKFGMKIVEIYNNNINL